jgi:hypothetical protein
MILVRGLWECVFVTREHVRHNKSDIINQTAAQQVNPAEEGPLAIMTDLQKS